MRSGNRELVDRLAAEYVLGTLRGGARRHFERWLRSPQVREMVLDWEDRLSPFESSAEVVAPPPEAWQRLERQLELRSKHLPPALFWGAAIVLAGALAAVAGWLAAG